MSASKLFIDLWQRMKAEAPEPVKLFALLEWSYPLQSGESYLCGILTDEDAARSWVEANKTYRVYEVHILDTILKAEA